jgi:MFS family permease
VTTQGSDSRVWRLLGRTPYLAGLPPEAAVLSAIAFSVALGFGIAAPALPLYARTFGVSAFAASAVISVFALMRLVSSPFAGRAIGRFGERLILTWGLVIVAASSLLAALAGSYWQLLVFRGVGGIGSAMFTVSAMALLLRVVSANQRGRAAGAFQAGFLIGGITGPALGGAVVGLSIRAPFLLYAGTLAVAALVAWRRLPAHVPEAEPEPGQPDAPAAAPATTLRTALRDSAFRAALAANLTNGFVTFGLRMSLVPLFVVEGLRQPASLSGIAFLVAAAANAVVLVPASRMADLRGRRPAMLVGTAATCAGMVALAVSGQPVTFLLALGVLGAAAAFLGSAPAAAAGDVAGPGGRGSVIAAFQMTADFGAIVGPLVAGLLADALGFEAAFLTGAAVASAALVFAVLMREPLQRTDAA